MVCVFDVYRLVVLYFGFSFPINSLNIVFFGIGCFSLKKSVIQSVLCIFNVIKKAQSIDKQHFALLLIVPRRGIEPFAVTL
jgi:hypothetical protein